MSMSSSISRATEKIKTPSRLHTRCFAPTSQISRTEYGKAAMIIWRPPLINCVAKGLRKGSPRGMVTSLEVCGLESALTIHVRGPTTSVLTWSISCMVVYSESVDSGVSMKERVLRSVSNRIQSCFTNAIVRKWRLACKCLSRANRAQRRGESYLRYRKNGINV